jgi:hypothetical protein
MSYQNNFIQNKLFKVSGYLENYGTITGKGDQYYFQMSPNTPPPIVDL